MEVIVVHLKRRLNMQNKRCVISLFLITLGLCSPIPVSGGVSGNPTRTLTNSGTITPLVPPPPPNPSWSILTSLVFPLIVLVLGTVVSGLILDYLREWRQKQKDGEFGTPVVIGHHL